MNGGWERKKRVPGRKEGEAQAEGGLQGGMKEVWRKGWDSHGRRARDRAARVNVSRGGRPEGRGDARGVLEVGEGCKRVQMGRMDGGVGYD